MSAHLVETWWEAEKGRSDQDMEDGHQTYWKNVMQQLAGEDFTGKSIVDLGCNQGGLLRELAGKHKIREGLGIDLAVKSVEVANQRKADLPLNYIATANLEEDLSLKARFDYGISTSVIYLVKDLSRYASQMKYLLKDGGSFFVDFADYDYLNSEAMKKLRDQIDSKASIGFQNHSLDSIGKAFSEAGFQVSIKRFVPDGFIQLSFPDTWYNSVEERLEFEYLRTYMFKVTKV